MGADNTCCMQVAEVELLAVTTSAPESARFLEQPIDTQVLAGQPATFFTTVNGPWPLQWRKNGVPIPGATKDTYTTEAITVDNTTNVYDVQIVGREASTPVHAVVFTPGATKSLGVHFLGGGANGAPTDVNTNWVMGVQPQAYWNNAPNSTFDLPGSLDSSDADGNPITIPYPLYDSDGNDSTMTVSYSSTGTWGSGTGVDTPTQRLLNGTIGETGPGSDTTVTFNNVPDGSHSVLVYTVAPPLHFQKASYKITGTTEETYYIREMNSDEYNAAPGFYRGVSKDVNNATIANFVRFDNVHPSGGAGGSITLTVDLLTSGDQRSGVNAIQLVLNSTAAGEPPTITVDPQPTVVASGGTAHLSVTATGNGLTYQWRKNGRNLPNGGNVTGATTPNLTISGFTDEDAGVYSVAVFNSGGSALSRNASVGTSNFSITDAQVAYLKFDETSGTTAANAVSGGQSGTVNGTATWGTGQAGKALAFDGGTFVSLSNFTKPTKQLAVSALVNADPSSGATVSFVHNGQNGGLAVGGTNSGLFDLGLVLNDTDGLLHLRGQIAAGPNIVTVTDPDAFPLGTFHQVAISADGAQLRLYKDGKQVDSKDYTGVLNVPATQALTIGGGVTVDDTGTYLDPNNAFIGSIDDVAVYSRALTASEVSAISAAAAQGNDLSTVTETPPVDETPTLTIAHASGNVTISWTGSGFRLQSSATVNSGYADVAGVTGTSYTTSSATGTTFYRLIK
jgi:hypothetical protein